MTRRNIATAAKPPPIIIERIDLFNW